MQLLPTIVIVALLGFFSVLTFALFLWHRQRLRLLNQEKPRNEPKTSPTRRLTLRDGKAIPHDQARDTASTRERYSSGLPSPDIEKHFDFDVEKGFIKADTEKAKKRSSRHSMKSLRRERGQSWAPGRPPWLQRAPEASDFPAVPNIKVQPPTRSKPRDRSRSIPRPSLINIERRGSSQTQKSFEPRQHSQTRASAGTRSSSQTQMTAEMQHKRHAIGITESLLNAYKGHTPWSGEVHKIPRVPKSPVILPGPAKSVAGSLRSSVNRWSTPAAASVHATIPPSASFIGSSRAVSQSDSIQPPPPLFSSAEYKSTPPETSVEYRPSSNRATPLVSPLEYRRSPDRTSPDRPSPLVSPIEEKPTHRVSFAPTQDYSATHDINRRSFLAMTESPTSSTSTERAFLGPKEVVPIVPNQVDTAAEPSNKIAEIPPYNEQSRPMLYSAPTPNALEVVERVRAFGRLRRERPPSLLEQRETLSEAFQLRDRSDGAVRKRYSIPRSVQEQDRPISIAQRRPQSSGAISKRPPSIEIDIPHFERGSLGSMSFFNSTPTPTRREHDLRRGPSVMSNRSGLTIASSEISSNWTIGKAELVNIYPSVADDEDLVEEEPEGVRESDRATPPYARMLRSKFGQYPKGKRDKALPTLPKSPLSQFPPGF